MTAYGQLVARHRLPLLAGQGGSFGLLRGDWGWVYRAVVWLIAAGFAIGLAIWAVKSMSVQVAILVGAAIIAGAIWLTRR
jgi:hypothetical protein